LCSTGSPSPLPRKDPSVIGELHVEAFKSAIEVLALPAPLPSAPVIEDDELLGFVGRERLFGRDIGWIDVHLLASARLSGLPLWTSTDG
jgi:hypothetical protein